MQLGHFSVSLTVKDLAVSRQFYERLGFRQIAGDPDKHWVILQNAGTTIGLFQGMFEKNILTFNPGWDASGQTLPDFVDIRDLQRQLRERGVVIHTPAEDAGDGPASFVMVDPDGNPILVDQHVPRPLKQ